MRETTPPSGRHPDCSNLDTCSSSPNTPGSVMPAPALRAKQHLPPAGIQIPLTLVRVHLLPTPPFPSCLHRLYARDNTSLRQASRLHSLCYVFFLCLENLRNPFICVICGSDKKAPSPLADSLCRHTRPPSQNRHACTGSMREERPPSGRHPDSTHLDTCSSSPNTPAAEPLCLRHSSRNLAEHRRDACATFFSPLPESS